MKKTTLLGVIFLCCVQFLNTAWCADGDPALMGKNNIGLLQNTGPAAVTSFDGKISASGTTAIFTEPADAVKAGYSATNPVLGATIIANTDTRYITAWTDATTCTLNTTTTWGASSTITSTQLPITEWKKSDGTIGGVVNSAGNVGIGTTSPGAKLHAQINSDATTAQTVFKLSNIYTNQEVDCNFKINSNKQFYLNGSSSYSGFSFTNPSGTLLGISYTGNVSIPLGKLTVSGTDDTTIAGNVGINTITPAGKLHTVLSAGSPALFGGDTVNELTAVSATNVSPSVLTKAAATATIDDGLGVSGGELCIVVSGTNATPGSYRVVSHVADTSVTLDRNCMTGASSGDLVVKYVKDTVAVTATDGTNGNRIMGYSAQDKPLQIGGDTLAATGHSLGAEDVLVGGKLEVNGAAYLDGQLKIGNQFSIIEPNYYGGLYYSVDDGTIIFTGDSSGYGNNNLIVSTFTQRNQDFDHSDLSTNPTVFIHSATDPDTDNTQWMSMSHDQTNGRITTGKGALNLGTTAATGHSLGVGDVLVGGKLEVDGTAYFDNEVYGDLFTVFSANINAGGLRYKADDGLHLWTNDANGYGNNNIVITDYTNQNKDFDHSDLSTNPTVFIHSTLNPDTSNNQWGSFSHDQENFVITTGAEVGTGSAPTTDEQAITFAPRGTEKFRVTQGIAMTPSATTASPTVYADDASIAVAYSVVRVEGDSGAVTLDTDPAIADGTADGQIVYIQGCDDTNTVTIADACNTQLAGGASAVLGEGDILTLLWDAGGSVWREVSRSDN